MLAGGLDHPYPPQNLPLHDAICAKGVVVSEAPLGSVARARDFPAPQFIISGLSRAVVVIEAALRSGSLITARAAADQGREVMAAPGSPLDPRARGSNALIKQGATLIESAEDVIAALGRIARASAGARRAAVRATRNRAGPARPTQEDRRAALADAGPLNDLARLREAPLGAVAAALTELELEGPRRLAAGRLRRVLGRGVPRPGLNRRAPPAPRRPARAPAPAPPPAGSSLGARPGPPSRLLSS